MIFSENVVSVLQFSALNLQFKKLNHGLWKCLWTIRKNCNEQSKKADKKKNKTKQNRGKSPFLPVLPVMEVGGVTVVGASDGVPTTENLSSIFQLFVNYDEIVISKYIVCGCNKNFQPQRITISTHLLQK